MIRQSQGNLRVHRSFRAIFLTRYSIAPLGLIFSLATYCQASEPIVVSSKKFTESYVLAEIAKRTLEQSGFQVENRLGMGGTIIVWEALRTAQIGLYPDYTGTIAEEILKIPARLSVTQMRDELAQVGVGMTGELGFNNTWALVMNRTVAERLQIHRISDLRRHPELRFGLTHEFLERRDGWQPLAAKYNLPTQQVTGIDHALGYAALQNGSIDVKDAYSTDAKLNGTHLLVLEDDLQFFPTYKAVFLYRLTLPSEAIAALRRLEGTLDERRMIELNAEAERAKDYAHAADRYFSSDASHARNSAKESLSSKIIRWSAQHVKLAGMALFLSIMAGIPLGIVASRGGPIGHTILGLAGVVQTIPSLALLALLVPLPFFGISARTAIAALFLYGLLPIVRNTATGLQDIPQTIRESAIALGLEPFTRFAKIYLPMASRSILGGIKTSAVINIGTATLAALIGAGGLGEPIISGLNLNDHATILQGAIPAAVMALLVQWSFELLDRLLIPRGLR